MSDTQSYMYTKLAPGDPFPWFSQRTKALPSFAVDSMAGRYIVLCFFGSADSPGGRSAVAALQRHRRLFDDNAACFFGVSVDPSDETEDRVRDTIPGIRFLWDFDARVSRQCGAAPRETTGQARKQPYDQFWMIVDPTLHVLGVFPFPALSETHQEVFDVLARLPAAERFGGFEIPAPVLVLPNVFDRQFCQHLISSYDEAGGTESGVHREGAGVHDHAFKRRRDYTIEDCEVIQRVNGLIGRRVVPEIKKLFFMDVTRMERYIVGCYSAEDGGHFRPHRDNGPGLTAHRRFAVSINLTDDFEGGEVSFPEYNRRGIKAPTGWCVVFPCAILHMVSPVTRGRRYAFLPFVYDREGEAIRQVEIERHQKAAAAETSA